MRFVLLLDLLMHPAQTEMCVLIGVVVAMPVLDRDEWDEIR